MRLALQWPASESAAIFGGAVLATPIDLGSLGSLRIQPELLLGTTICTSQHLARIDLTVPADPVLRGLRLGVQSLVTHTSGARLSTAAVVNLQ